MRLYADENFSHLVVERLRQLGHDVLTVREAGKSQQAIPDSEVLQFATKTERVLITFNAWDFIKLHDTMPHHTGIIVCTLDRDSNALAQRIHETIESQPNMKGKLLRVTRANPSSF